MPFRGIILILMITIVICMFCKEEIYKEITKFFKETDEGENEK